MATVASSEPAVGELAPDFTLPSTSGEKITLSAFRGRQIVLLAWFPLAFTAVCTTELCAFGEDESQFAEAGAKVFGISVDHTASQQVFQQKAAFSTELLSDFKREVSRRYGVLIEDLYFSKRAYFLVDTAGKVAWKWVEAELGHRRDNDELLAQIRKLA
ncbi:MAG: redoxin domain-containing protein [Candidatus Eisenbacteria bacterium]